MTSTPKSFLFAIHLCRCMEKKKHSGATLTLPCAAIADNAAPKKRLPPKSALMIKRRLES